MLLQIEGFASSLAPNKAGAIRLAFVWPTSHIGMLHPAGDSKARNRAADFLTFAQAAMDGIPYVVAKEKLACSLHQAETRKSLFEELGLLYVPYRSDRLVVTPLGEQFANLLNGKDLSNLSDDVSRKATALLIWAQCRVQVDRPQSRGVPKPSEADWRGCNVKPYAAAWLAVRDLAGTLFLHEFMGVLRYLHQVSDYPKALARIVAARKSKTLLANKTAWENRGLEMNYAIYWRSHLSVAQQLMSWEPEAQTLVANTSLWPIVDAALRFQSGCGGNELRGITSSKWSSADDYFINLAGAACPPFLATGTPKLTTFDGQALADLRTYNVISESSGYRIIGGPELCTLPLRLPCYHSDSPKRLLRIDDKFESSAGMIELRLGFGRPITNLPLLEKALGKGNA